MDLAIKGRTAIVTGGDSNIGLATAKLLAGKEVNIILNAKSCRIGESRGRCANLCKE